MKAYQRLSRRPMFRRSRSRPKNITNSSQRVDHSPIFINLAAQAMDEDINHIRLWIKAVIEDMPEDHGLGDRPIRLAHQILEQSEFARLVLNLFAAAPRLPREQIQRQIP